MTKILAFSGSGRRDSYNQQLVSIAAAGARQAGAEVTLINLRDFPLPLFHEDLEASGRPEPAKQLKELFLSHQGLLIASPEYNSSLSPLLKNTLDWVSRREAGEGRLAAFAEKTAAVMAASPGHLGGLRGLVHLRAILSNVGVLVLPEQVTLSNAHEAFDETGNLKDPAKHETALELGAALADTLQKLSR